MRCHAVGIVCAAVGWSVMAFAADPPERPVITPATVDRLSKVGELERDIYRIAWIPGTNHAACQKFLGPIEIIDIDALEHVAWFAQKREVTNFAFNPAMNLLAFADKGPGKNVTMEVLDTGEPRYTLETGQSQPSVAFSPDGWWLATGGYGTQAKLWNAESGELVHTLDTPGEGGLTVVFSPDGERLAVGNRNDITRVFDVKTGKLIFATRIPSTQGLAFSPDGRTLAVTYVSGGVILYDVPSGKARQCEVTAKELYSVAWSPSSELLATSGLEGKITLWNPDTLKIVKQLESPHWCICVTFTPDGTRLLTSGGGQLPNAERKLTVWGIPTE